MPLSPGTRLGLFEILGPLGQGGMGEVYRARDTKLGREVAIKVLPDALRSDLPRLARFRREATLAVIEVLTDERPIAPIVVLLNAVRFLDEIADGRRK